MTPRHLSKLIFVGAVLLLLLFQIEKTNPEISGLQDEVNETAINYGSASLVNLDPVPPFLVRSSAPVFLAAYLDGREIGGKNSALRWPLASITKLMAALVVRENLDLGQPVKISEKAVGEEGAAGGFSPGETFAVGDLLKATLIVSSNDAMAALADFYFEIKKEPLPVAMNWKAKELDMNYTSFVDATGLSFLNQSTAEDLAKLARYLFSNRPEILTITCQAEVAITDLNSKIKRSLRNTNEFAGEPDFLGGKTGFTDEANGNLLSLFLNNGRPVLIVVFGADDRFGETRKIYQTIH